MVQLGGNSLPNEAMIRGKLNISEIGNVKVPIV